MTPEPIPIKVGEVVILRGKANRWFARSCRTVHMPFVSKLASGSTW